MANGKNLSVKQNRIFLPVFLSFNNCLGRRPGERGWRLQRKTWLLTEDLPSQGAKGSGVQEVAGSGKKSAQAFKDGEKEKAAEKNFSRGERTMSGMVASGLPFF